MAGETQKATTQTGAQVFVEDSPGANTYTKLFFITEFDLPKPLRERLEATHLESTGKEYVPGDIDFGEFELKGRYRAESDTDLRLEALAAGEDEIGVVFILVERGTKTKQYSGDMLVLGYGPDAATRGVTDFTANCTATGAFTPAAYVSDPPSA